MNQGFSNQNGNARVQNFLEALKSRQVSSGQEAPQSVMPGFETFGERKRVEEARRAEFLANRKKEEIEIFSATKSGREKRIGEIQERLVIMSKRVERKDPEVRKAAIQEVVKANISDEFFLNGLQKIVDLFNSNTGNSGDWLRMFNSRSKQVGGVYGKRAKAGGTKYTQSLDVNPARSVG